MDINGKVAIVTGAASGIGRATAIGFAQQGAEAVVIVDIDSVGLAETAKAVENEGAASLPLILDVTKSEALQHMYDEADKSFGRIHIVFNNAGIVSGPPAFPDTDLARMRLVIELDLIAVIESTTLAIRYMRERGGGAIVNMSSPAGLGPLPADAPYAAAKAGVLNFSQSCEPLNESYNVRVNAICPGITETPILTKLGGGATPDWLEPLLRDIKVLTAEEIAAQVIAIVKDDSLAGQYILVENEPKEKQQ